MGDKHAAKTTPTPLIEIRTAFISFITVNLISAVFNNLNDCDETFNYWEPLHHLLFPSDESFQTWEYDKEYSLRSWAYLSLHATVLFIHSHLFRISKPILFQFLRVGLAVITAVSQLSAYRGVLNKFGPSLAKTFFVISCIAPGTFIASTAFLPSSCCMVFGYALIGTWLNSKTQNAAVYSIGFGAILGWPFFAALGIPLVFDLLVLQKRLPRLIYWSAEVAIIGGGFTFALDYYFYKKLMLSPINLVVYNIFSGKGPDLYGVESPMYYVKNLALNWNIVSIMAVLSLPVSVAVEMYFRWKMPEYKPAVKQFVLYLSPLYIWLGIFMAQPHKEERFLFPVYGFMAFGGAVFITSVQKLMKRVFDEWRYVPSHLVINKVFLGIFVMLSVSRILAMVLAYGNSLNIYSNVLNHIAFDDTTPRYNLCIGKEWHRFGTHFLIPAKMDVHFIESEFQAQLPGKFIGKWPTSTRTTLQPFNDDNLLESDRFFPIQNCDAIIDLEGPFISKTLKEPQFSNDETWTIAKKMPYLNKQASPAWSRSFYLPYIFEKYNKFDNYVLLLRQ